MVKPFLFSHQEDVDFLKLEFLVLDWQEQSEDSVELHELLSTPLEPLPCPHPCLPAMLYKEAWSSCLTCWTIRFRLFQTLLGWLFWCKEPLNKDTSASLSIKGKREHDYAFGCWLPQSKALVFPPRNKLKFLSLPRITWEVRSPVESWNCVFVSWEREVRSTSTAAGQPWKENAGVFRSFEAHKCMAGSPRISVVKPSSKGCMKLGERS